MSLGNFWTCPKCERRFANRNQSHSCGQYSVEGYLKDKSPYLMPLYRRFSELVRGCGPVTLTPTKNRIGFQVRMIFAAVTVRKTGLACQVVLSRRRESPRFTRIDSISPGNHIHHFRIQSMDELDEEVVSWLQEAYQVGEQKHLSRRLNDSPVEPPS